MILAVILLASHIFHFKFHVTFKGFTHYIDLHQRKESQWCPSMSETVHYYLSLNFFFSPPPHTLWNIWKMPAWLAQKWVVWSSHRAHPCNEVQSPEDVGFAAFWVFKASSLDGHPCKSPCLPPELTAQSCELKFLVETREQNLYTNEIICMKCYFSKTA